MNQTTQPSDNDAADNAGTARRQFILGTESDDRLAGGLGPDVIAGRGGNDSIIDTVGENLLYGNEGDDRLIGHGSFTGGPGNDLIRGDGKFRFYLGDGHDTIGSLGRQEFLTDSGSYFKDHSLNDSVLSFGPGIAPSAIRLERRGGDLLFTLDDNNSVTIENWFADRNCRLGQVVFATGESWNRTTIAGMPVQITGTTGNDTLEGTVKNDVIVGLAGHDFIFAPVGENLIFGGAGNDVIMGQGAIHGGAGDDNIVARGDSRQNIYYYGRGDGHDTLHITGAADTSARSGTIAFLDPLQESDLWFRRQEDDLAVTVVGSTAGITISNWFLGTGHQVKNFELGNQKTMPADRVDALVQAMAQCAAPLAADTALPDSMRQTLAPILASSWTSTATT
ncbi:calcium-binding protein [Herbaspirillum sp. alder98]|uniref:calcium-binding protein n=1 Tax=Herbaspirillum sp. alder98 TaxID=2913096 RepID=UPI001CD89A03|nr:calcium-binding protein [Herbaspirillum sp. alder98]MCA1326721.1 hypothetical protein [Herbaspirillum sp. alder98]